MQEKFIPPRWYQIKAQWACGRLMPARYALGRSATKWFPNHFPEHGAQEYFGDGAHGYPTEKEALAGLTVSQKLAYKFAKALKLSGY